MPPITADDEGELGRQLKQSKNKFASIGLGFSHLGESETGRRRQSSNFFDILTDPQRYQE